MKTIPLKTVDLFWDEFMDMPDDEAQPEFQKLMDSQPALTLYLLSIDEEHMPPDDRGHFLAVGCSVMYVILKAGPTRKEITPEQIESVEEKNLRVLEGLEEGSEFDVSEHAAALSKTYNQWPVLGMSLQALMEGYEDSMDNAPEEIGLLFMNLKTVIDCLDA